MKRIISFSLLIIFLISFAGCGKSPENTESTEQSKATSQSVTATTNNTEKTTEKKLPKIQLPNQLKRKANFPVLRFYLMQVTDVVAIMLNQSIKVQVTVR